MTEIERLLSEGFITEDFLKEEERCGYLVPSEMKKAWAIQMDLLVKLFDVCKRHNLKIWSSGGTMLGAVRHKGFIPWDDDSDVFLPRKDYEKLIRLPREEFPEPYFLQSEFTDAENNLYLPYARICNSNTTVNENVCTKNKVTWNSGIFVDIFPVDGISKSNLKLYVQANLIKFYNVAHHSYVLDKNKTFLATILRKILHWSIVGYKTFPAIRRINRIASWESYEKATSIGEIQCPCCALEKRIFDKSDWEEVIWLPFENIKVPIPAGYDRILKKSYGNYMEYPPIEDRGKHHNIEVYPETPYKDYYHS